MNINVNNLSFAYDTGENLFEHVNFKISGNRCVALIGDNGTGKTTFLNLMMGKLVPSQGTININGYCCMVDQLVPVNHTNSPGEYQLKRLRNVILRQPDFLLLDEPTANLDKKGIAYLEKMLFSFKGMSIVVSHDKVFLSHVANALLELDEKQLRFYDVGLEEFQKIKQVDNDRRYRLVEYEKKERRKNRRALARIEEKARRAKSTTKKLSDSDKKAKGLGGRYDKVQKGLEKKVVGLRKGLTKDNSKNKPFEKMGFKLLASKQPYSNMQLGLTFKNIGRAKQNLIEGPIRLSLHSHEVIAILGENGTGKTTLLNNIFKTLQHKRVRVNLFQQEIQHVWENSLPLLKQFKQQSGRPEQVILDIAGALGLNRNLLNRLPAELSGGQLIKAQLVLQLIKPFDVLLLDEPSNYLDYDGVEALIDFLKDNAACVILVSHDEYLVRKCASKCYVIENNQWLDYLTCDDYFKK